MLLLASPRINPEIFGLVLTMGEYQSMMVNFSLHFTEREGLGNNTVNSIFKRQIRKSLVWN